MEINTDIIEEKLEEKKGRGSEEKEEKEKGKKLGKKGKKQF